MLRERERMQDMNEREIELLKAKGPLQKEALAEKLLLVLSATVAKQEASRKAATSTDSLVNAITESLMAERYWEAGVAQGTSIVQRLGLDETKINDAIERGKGMSAEELEEIEKILPMSMYESGQS